MLPLMLLLGMVAVTRWRDWLDRPIEFVIPYEYYGPFVVIAHRDYPDALEVYDTHYALTVPANGIVRTWHAWVFDRWHQCTVPHEGPCVTYGNVGANTPAVYWFFVGPRTDFEAFCYGPDARERELAWLASRGIAHRDLRGHRPPP